MSVLLQVNQTSELNSTLFDRGMMFEILVKIHLATNVRLFIHLLLVEHIGLFFCR